MTLVELLIATVHAHGRAHDLFTFRISMARSALAELNTHRTLSRNTTSSRAASVKMMYPQYSPQWTKAARGMSGDFLEDSKSANHANTIWLDAFNAVTTACDALETLGVHRQDRQRLLEPFMLVDTVATGTRRAWDAFCELRCPDDAYPPIRAAALTIRSLLRSNELPPARDSHVPLLIDGEDKLAERYLLSAARCARGSYGEFGSKGVAKDIALAQRLIRDGHMSPLEHQCVPVTPAAGQLHSGWVTYRHRLEGAA